MPIQTWWLACTRKPFYSVIGPTEVPRLGHNLFVRGKHTIILLLPGLPSRRTIFWCQAIKLLQQRHILSLSLSPAAPGASGKAGSQEGAAEFSCKAHCFGGGGLQTAAMEALSSPCRAGCIQVAGPPALTSGVPLMKTG